MRNAVAKLFVGFCLACPMVCLCVFQQLSLREHESTISEMKCLIVDLYRRVEAIQGQPIIPKDESDASQ